MHLFLNCVAASAGGGLTYLRNVVPYLSRASGAEITLLVRRELAPEIESRSNLSVIAADVPAHAGLRFYWEQRRLPELIRKSRSNVLVSTGNFSLRRSPVPQILLSGNSLYVSPEYSRDLLRRGEYGMWVDNRVRGSFARRSVDWADRTAAPSRSFATQLQQWTGRPILSIYHGFDPEIFFRDQTPLPGPIRQQLEAAHRSLRLLFVSHYNYYRNFETLFRGLALLKTKLGTREVKLFLTCKLQAEQNPGSFDPTATGKLIHELGLAENVVELGAISYQHLHKLYRACDIYVSAAYAETFAHPLVEAMASGLPIVASDLPVHREIARDAGRCFATFSGEGFASQIAQMVDSPNLRQKLIDAGSDRIAAFSWQEHVKSLLELAAELDDGRP